MHSCAVVVGQNNDCIFPLLTQYINLFQPPRKEGEDGLTLPYFWTYVYVYMCATFFLSFF